MQTPSSASNNQKNIQESIILCISKISKNIYYYCKTLKLEQHNLPNEQHATCYLKLSQISRDDYDCG